MCLNIVSVVQAHNNFSINSRENAGARIVGCVYAASQIILMVSCTGTFVNNDSTSKEARNPLVSVHFRMSINWFVDAGWYFADKYGVIILFISLAVL